MTQINSTTPNSRLVRVVAPHFVAGFVTDGVVRRAAPILKRLVGLTDDQARAVIAARGWKASVVREQTGGGDRLVTE